MSMSVAELMKMTRNSNSMSVDDLLDKPAIWWVHIDRFAVGDVECEGTSRKERKAQMYFREFDKPYNPGARNARFLKRSFGGNDTSQWRGKIIGLYLDPTVQYAGVKVGGIRFTLPDGTHTEKSMSPEKAARAARKAWPPPAPPSQRSKPQQARPAPPPAPRFYSDYPVKEWAGRFLSEAPRAALMMYLISVVGLKPPAKHAAHMVQIEAAIKALPVEQDEDDATPDVAEAGGKWDDGPPED